MTAFLQDGGPCGSRILIVALIYALVAENVLVVLGYSPLCGGVIITL
jgi:hypothetical protein